MKYGQSDIGCCSFYSDSNSAFISSICIKSQFLNKKIGSNMMSMVKEYITKKGCTQIRLQVHNTNIVAKLFYENCGFNKDFELDDWLTMEWSGTDGK